MTCPKCGHEFRSPKVGRPRLLDDHRVLSLTRKGWSLAEIADLFNVTRAAIQASLKRSKK